MEIFNDSFVVRHEREWSCHLAHHHRFAPKDLRAIFRIHTSVIDAMATANHKPAEAYFFDCFDKATFLVPCGFKPAARAELFRDLQNPFRPNFRSFGEERAARFANFGTEQPFHAFCIKVAAREHVRFTAAHQAVTTVFDIAMRHTAQESSEERNVQIIAMERIERTNSIFKLYIENATELFV